MILSRYLRGSSVGRAAALIRLACGGSSPSPSAVRVCHSCWEGLRRESFPVFAFDARPPDFPLS